MNTLYFIQLIDSPPSALLLKSRPENTALFGRQNQRRLNHLYAYQAPIPLQSNAFERISLHPYPITVLLNPQNDMGPLRTYPL